MGQRIRDAVLLMVLIGSIGASGKGWAASEPARPVLEVKLEDRVLLEGQSAYMITCLYNRGSGDLTDVAPISPRLGHLQVDLLRRDTGKPVLRRIPQSPPTRSQGTTLAPGQVICDVSDLTLYFGQTSQNRASFSSRIGAPYLAPGEYLLKWVYDLHTNVNSTVALRGELEFSVRELSSDAKELSLMTEFLAGVPSVGIDRDPLHSYARKWLPRFYGSKYLLRVYMTTGTQLNDLDFDPILDGAVASGAPPERIAALLGARLSMTDLRGKFGHEWKDRVRGRVAHPLERDILSIEPRKPSGR